MSNAGHGMHTSATDPEAGTDQTESSSHQRIPSFRSPQWSAEVRRMVTAQAPLRFAVVAHDPGTKDSAILAWGFDYGDGDVIIESARDDRRWLINSPDAIRKHFPAAPQDGLEIIWIDNPT